MAVTFARVDDRSHIATYLAEAAPLSDAGRFDTVLVRFRVANPGDSAITWIPRLEWRAGSGPFAAVPADGSEPGVPIYAAREWVTAGQHGGSKPGPTGEPLPPAEFLTGIKSSPDAPAVAGERVLGVNPGPARELPSHAWTEVEFAFRTSVDAVYEAAYDLRLVDAAGGERADSIVGRLALGAAPSLDLTPGQLTGIPADPGHAAATRVRYELDAPRPGTGAATLAAFVISVDPNRTYRLVASGGPAAPGGFVTPHGGYSATPDACAACHRTHSAGIGNLVAAANTQASVCFTCHDGSGASADVAARYASPGIPADNATAGAFYRHDATVATTHLSAGANEFQDPPGTPVLNRHAECGDCHDSHRADGTAATISAAGWTASGATAGISGVAVSNRAAGSAPTYGAWTSAADAHPVALEYELCLKCHSGFTRLRPRDLAAPSTWALDKGIELNPSNASTHPVEGAGSNGTAAMAASLTGSSPSKQWNFLVGETVRCVNCHADPATFDRVSPPAAGGDLSPHVSSNRGILFQPYRDRLLKSSGGSYDAADFALCYVCHAEAPFRDVTGTARTDTNFQFHGLHVSNLQGKGSGGTSIDTAGDGQGDAVCAECHFRIHSTALAYRPDDRSNERLVNFAPNVTAAGSAWTRTGIAAGTCAVTCHGAPHLDASYGPPPDDMILAIVPTPASFTAAGEVVEVRYVVTNATGATISGPITVTDPAVGPADCPVGDLGVGATVTCVAAYAVTAGDVAAGHVDLAAHADAGASHSNDASVRLVLAP